MQRKADNNSKSGKTWYIPHHWVVHAAKPRKVRVVFDCSAEYRGTSLNNQLTSGPEQSTSWFTDKIQGRTSCFHWGCSGYISPSKGT